MARYLCILKVIRNYLPVLQFMLDEASQVKGIEFFEIFHQEGESSYLCPLCACPCVTASSTVSAAMEEQL